MGPARIHCLRVAPSLLKANAGYTIVGRLGDCRVVVSTVIAEEAKFGINRGAVPVTKSPTTGQKQVVLHLQRGNPKVVAVAAALFIVPVVSALFLNHRIQVARQAREDREAISDLLSHVHAWMSAPNRCSGIALRNRVSAMRSLLRECATGDETLRLQSFDDALTALDWDEDLSLAAKGDVASVHKFIEQTPIPWERSDRANRIRAGIALLVETAALSRKLELSSSQQLEQLVSSGWCPDWPELDRELQEIARNAVVKRAQQLLAERVVAAKFASDRAASIRAERRSPSLNATIEEIALDPRRYSGRPVVIQCMDVLGRAPRRVSGTDDLAITVESARGSVYFGTAGDVRVLVTPKIAKFIVETQAESTRFSCATAYADCAAPSEGSADPLVLRIYWLSLFDGKVSVGDLPR